MCLIYSFVDSEIQASPSSLYKCTDVLARQVQEHALAAMFGKLFAGYLSLLFIYISIIIIILFGKFMQFKSDSLWKYCAAYGKQFNFLCKQYYF